SRRQGTRRDASAVSKQVAALEARLGAKLLVRSTRAIALTRAGEAFFPEARRLSEEVEAAEAAARDSERTLEGALKGAASVGFGAGRLMPPCAVSSPRIRG